MASAINVNLATFKEEILKLHQQLGPWLEDFSTASKEALKNAKALNEMQASANSVQKATHHVITELSIRYAQTMQAKCDVLMGAINVKTIVYLSNGGKAEDLANSLFENAEKRTRFIQDLQLKYQKIREFFKLDGKEAKP